MGTNSGVLSGMKELDPELRDGGMSWRRDRRSLVREVSSSGIGDPGGTGLIMVGCGGTAFMRVEA